MSEQAQALTTTIDAPDLQVLGAALRERLDEIQAKLSARIIEFEQDALEHAEQVDAITVTDASSYEVLSAKVKSAVVFLDGAEAFFEPWRTLFYNPYQSLLERKRSVVDSPSRAVKSAKDRLIRYDRDMQAKADNEARIKAEEQRRAEEARKLELAADAETAGMSEQAVQAILTAPSTAPTPVVQSSTPKIAGQSSRESWKAEVFDFPALVVEAARRFVKSKGKDKELFAYLEFNQVALNNQAKTHHAELVNVIPGVRGVNSGTLAIRR